MAGQVRPQSSRQWRSATPNFHTQNLNIQLPTENQICAENLIGDLLNHSFIARYHYFRIIFLFGHPSRIGCGCRNPLLQEPPRNGTGTPSGVRGARS